MKEIRLEMRAKNNVLYQAIMARWPTLTAAANELGTQATTLSNLLNFKIEPRRKDGTLRKWAANIESFLGIDGDTLFPVQLYERMRGKSTRVAEVNLIAIPWSDPRLRALPAPESCQPDALDPILDRAELLEILKDRLSPRSYEIIRKSFGIGCDRTGLIELAQEFRVSKANIHALRKKALKTLKRSPRVIRMLSDMVGDEL